VERRWKYRKVFLLFLLLVSTKAVAQIAVSGDSTAKARDTTLSSRDTLGVTSPSGVDSVVSYQASDSVVYMMGKRTTFLHGKSSIRYKELGLKAELININWNTSQLRAEGVVDSTDSAGVRMRGFPELQDGSERYNGSVVTYNFRSKKGKIDFGKTEIEKGLYYGDAIKRVESDVLFVKSGRFTSCELEHPHYYFASPTMKVIVREKVIARPIFLYIEDVPVFALPFGVFPTERGRRSGLIVPTFGESSRGRYLLNLGYYWAMNDYMDLSVRGDGYSLGSYTLYSDFRYALRYNYSGGISGSYAQVVTDEESDPNYGEQELFNVRLSHAQEFNPTTRLVVDFTFTSGAYYQETSNDLGNLLRQNVVSNATLTKSWEGTPNSMVINVRRDQNLQATPGSIEIRDLLPSIGFSRSQSFPFRSSDRSGTADKWYELLGYSYNGVLLNTRTRSVLLDGSRETDQRGGIQHQFAFNVAPKLGYFTVTPFLNFTERWYNKSIQRYYDSVDSTTVTEDVSGFRALHTYDMGVTMSTKVYGIFQPGILGIRGIRHQVLPSISYTYAPDFSAPSYGYYDTYLDGQGIEQKYDVFEKEVFGGAPGEKRQAISFRLGNVFEMKTAADDTTSRENKFQLMNVDLSTGYNFARDSLNFDEIYLGFRTAIGQILSIGGSARYNLYKFEVDPNNAYGGRRVNKFLLSEEGRLGDMTGFTISVGTRLSGEKKKTEAGPVMRTEDSTASQTQKSGYVSLYDREAVDFSIPWNLDLSWNFSQSQPGDPRQKYRSSTLSGSLGFNLTDLWKITATASYDMVSDQVVAPQITVYRDLHCWEMNFSWVPTGPYRNYKLEIRVKAPQLQDVKVTRQGSERGIY
jgi:lipopolysaccharide assembly outer membrane protein LptD (OstA)